MTLRDARTDDVGAELRGSVCIIGAGAAGITLARRLAADLDDVLLVEGGGQEYDPEIQSLYEGRNLGVPYHDLDVCRLRFFGGTTNHWAGYCRSNDPGDFDPRPDLGLPAWPVGYAELEPYLGEAARLLDISPRFFAPSELLAARGLDGTSPIDGEGELFFTAVNQRTERRLFAEEFGAELVRSGRIHVVTHLNAVELVLTGDGNAIDHVLCRTLDGKTVRVSGRRIVLATHAIENARLMLASNRQESAGVGNRADNVGRHFMEHPYVYASVLAPTPSFPAFYRRNVAGPQNLLAGLTLRPEVMRREGVLSYTCYFETSDRQRTYRRALRRAFRGLFEPFSPELLDDARTVLEDPLLLLDEARTRVGLSPSSGEHLVLDQMIEQAPNPDSRVLLSAEERDALGQPRAHLDWRFSELDVRTLRVGQESVVRELGALGLGRLQVEEITMDLLRERAIGHYHHYGTTRMAETARDGVVDRNLRVFGLENLFVCGGSVMPRPGAHGPTMHIVAFAMRLGDHLAGELRG